jgi:hypothetical protein
MTKPKLRAAATILYRLLICIQAAKPGPSRAAGFADVSEADELLAGHAGSIEPINRTE